MECARHHQQIARSAPNAVLISFAEDAAETGRPAARVLDIGCGAGRNDEFKNTLREAGLEAWSAHDLGRGPMLSGRPRGRAPKRNMLTTDFAEILAAMESLPAGKIGQASTS